MTITTTFSAPAGATPSLASCAFFAVAWSSLLQPSAPSMAKPAAPAPPARRACLRVKSPAKRLGVAPRDVDRADRVLVGQLVEHLAHHPVHVALVVAEVVEERLQGRPGDLELGRCEGEPEGLLVGADQVDVVVS